jgi:hypothetical protein
MKVRAARWWDPRTWLAFAFWELRTIFKGYSGDGLADWKATGVIMVVETLGLGAITSAWAVYHERRLIDHSIYIMALAVFILNVVAAWVETSAGSDFSETLKVTQNQLKLVAG